MNTTIRNTIIVIAVLVLILLGFLAWQERQASQGQQSSTSTSAVTNATSSNAASSSTASSTATVSPSGVSMTGNGTIKLLPAVKIPNFTAPLKFSADISADERTSLTSSFEAVQATLKKDPNNFNALITLGMLRKEAGDYAGAATDWAYVSAIYPTNIVSFANLGDLYMNFIHDYAKAVTYFKQELVNNPKAVYVYLDLYSLYTNQYPQSSSVIEAMLNAGIAANPKATELQTTLAEYQKSH